VFNVVAKRLSTRSIAIRCPTSASNGGRSVVKAAQSGFVDYGNAYLTVPPGTVIEKTFHLEVYPIAEEWTVWPEYAKKLLRHIRL